MRSFRVAKSLHLDLDSVTWNVGTGKAARELGVDEGITAADAWLDDDDATMDAVAVRPGVDDATLAAMVAEGVGLAVAVVSGVAGLKGNSGCAGPEKAESRETLARMAKREKRATGFIEKRRRMSIIWFSVKKTNRRQTV